MKKFFVEEPFFALLIVALVCGTLIDLALIATHQKPLFW